MKSKYKKYYLPAALLAVVSLAVFMIEPLNAWFFFNAKNGMRQQWVFNTSCNPNSRPIQVYYDDRLATIGTQSKRNAIAIVHQRWNDKDTIGGTVNVNLLDDYTASTGVVLNNTITFEGNTELIRQILENPNSSNAGKVYVVYDSDGAAFELLGITSSEVLGVGIPLTLDSSNPNHICSGILVLNAARLGSNDNAFYYTLVHELGHVLGFAHSIIGANSGLVTADSNATDLPIMFPFLIQSMVNQGTSRQLSADEKAGLYNVYGQ